MAYLQEAIRLAEKMLAEFSIAIALCPQWDQKKLRLKVTGLLTEGSGMYRMGRPLA